jgi:O-antigen/teichoic acid export membrane protein
MTVKTRLLSNTMANVAGIGMSAVFQIASVPVLTSAWGAEGYGVWLMLATVPAYLAMTDFGFVQAATNDMTMQVARGARRDAVKTFQSIWVLVLLAVLSVLCASFLLLGAIFAAGGEGGGWPGSNTRVLLVLVAYAGLALCSRVIIAGFRSTGFYAQGSLMIDSLLLLEGIGILAAAGFGGGYVSAALSLLAIRATGIAAFYFMLRRAVPWLPLGMSAASFEEIRRLVRPALAAMTIPAALSLNLQGMVLVVGAVLSPAAASVFVPVRAASRLIIQTIGALNRATMPEISAASATGRRAALYKIISLNMASVVLVLLPGAALFAAYGKQVVEIWSRSQISPDATFVAIMALVMVVHGAWYYASNMLLATNSHRELAGTLLVTSVASVLLAIPLARSFGLTGVGLALLFNEAVCLARTAYVAMGLRPNFAVELRAALFRDVSSARRSS